MQSNTMICTVSLSANNNNNKKNPTFSHFKPPCYISKPTSAATEKRPCRSLFNTAHSLVWFSVHFTQRPFVDLIVHVIKRMQTTLSGMLYQRKKNVFGAMRYNLALRVQLPQLATCLPSAVWASSLRPPNATFSALPHFHPFLDTRRHEHLHLLPSWPNSLPQPPSERWNLSVLSHFPELQLRHNFRFSLFASSSTSFDAPQQQERRASCPQFEVVCHPVPPSRRPNFYLARPSPALCLPTCLPLWQHRPPPPLVSSTRPSYHFINHVFIYFIFVTPPNALDTVATCIMHLCPCPNPVAHLFSTPLNTPLAASLILSLEAKWVTF